MEYKATDIRKAAVAGSFYPGDPSTLAKTIAGMFAEVDKIPLRERPLGLIAPHAGYPYSGKTAARAYKLLEGLEYETVVIVAPSHTVFFQGCAVFEGAGYETPLGVVETDPEMARRIASIHPLVYFSGMGHSTGSSRGEHALEVHLPFLQVVLGKFKLVAIIMGDQEQESVSALGEVLASALKGTNSLMIASTDLSHFYDQKKANKLDGAVRTAIEMFDPKQLVRVIQSGQGEACGAGPVASVMQAAKRLGSKEVQFLEYTTSGETTGDFSEVVGYLSAAIIASQDTSAKPKPDKALLGAKPAAPNGVVAFSVEDKDLLKRIAHDAIGARLKLKSYEPPTTESLEIKRGLFVTIKLDGELRGCIGQLKSRQPLYEAVADMALAAAFEDPRFPQVTAGEYERLEYEISVLSALERVKDFRDIKVGRDGLMIKLDMHSGLLLPQVATEFGWDRTQFLEQTCLKAGLPKESYKDKYAEIYRFSAAVF